MLLAQVSISAMNDWADRDRDALAGKWRPIPLGLVPPSLALAVAVAAAGGAILLAGAAGLGEVPLLLLIVGLLCGWVYDLVLKPRPLSFLPFAVAYPLLPVWVGAIAGHIEQSLLALFLAGAPLATAIHLADALPDRAEDRAAGIRNLSIVLGSPRADLLTAAALVGGGAILVAGSIGRRPLPAFGMLVVAVIGALGYLRMTTNQAANARWVIVAATVVIVSIWFLIT